MLAQMSQQPRIREVYRELFREEGTEIYVKSAKRYREEWPESVRFGDLVQLAQKRGEICIGVKMHGHDHNLATQFGIEINPPKNEVYNFTSDDSLIVMAEDGS